MEDISLPQMSRSITHSPSSVYSGHAENMKYDTLKDDDVVLMIHDDVEILSTPQEACKWLKLLENPEIGFIGVAGTTKFDKDLGGMWWQARHYGKTRGFVFQGKDNLTMTPNHFGPFGQVSVLDGCFLACTYRTYKKYCQTKPNYLSSDWDFYDIHMTSAAFLDGLKNYAVPIIVRHESDGQMRPEWFKAKDEFMKYHANNMPFNLPFDKTHGVN